MMDKIVLSATIVKRVILIFLLQGLFLISYSQIVGMDSLVIREARKCTIEDFDMNECMKGLLKADSLFQKGNFYISGGLSVTTFSTYNFLLEEKYHFKKTGVSCLRNSYNCCFMKQQQSIIDKRFGENFLESLSASADSLDSIGMGYKPPVFKSGKGSIEKYIYCAKKDILMHYKYFEFLIYFTIDESGRVKDIIDYSQTEDEKKLAPAVIKLIKEGPGFSPASFNKQNVKANYVLIVSSGMLSGFDEYCEE